MKWHQTIGKQKGEGFNVKMLEILKEVFKVKGKSVIDLGCAEGAFCKEALEKGADSVIGIDINPEMLEKLSSWLKRKTKKNQAKLSTILGDFTGMDIGMADIVLCLNVLRQTAEPTGALVQACASAGELIITNAYKKAEGAKLLSVEQVSEILESQSFAVEVLKSYRKNRVLIVGRK